MEPAGYNAVCALNGVFAGKFDPTWIFCGYEKEQHASAEQKQYRDNAERHDAASLEWLKTEASCLEQYCYSYMCSRKFDSALGL